MLNFVGTKKLGPTEFAAFTSKLGFTPLILISIETRQNFVVLILRYAIKSGLNQGAFDKFDAFIS